MGSSKRRDAPKAPLEPWERTVIHNYFARQLADLAAMRWQRLKLNAQDKAEREAKLARRRTKMSEFVVSEARLKTATRVLVEKCRVLDLQQQLDIADEIRWADQVELNAKGDHLDFTLTDLQIVMLAAAFAAVAEAGGEIKEGDGALAAIEEQIPF